MSKQNKTPVSGTGEWAAHVFNIQNGCEHDCRYCYAKTQAIRFGKNTAEGWKTPDLNDKMLNKNFGKKSGTIMFPTTHDITMDNVNDYIYVLKRMLKAGNKVLIVTKPHLECIDLICRYALNNRGYQDQILFRFTIGSANDEVLSFWEPNAPKFAERLACLKLAHSEDYATSVSCEPMLDDQIGLVVDAVRPFVTDAIWLGKPNKLLLRAGMNTTDEVKTTEMATALLDKMNDSYIHSLYKLYCNDPMIKWKDSIKQIVGLERSTVKGLDV